MEPRSHFKLNDIRGNFEIQNKRYNPLCCILHLWRKKHFVSVFFLGGLKWLVDDLNPTQAILLDEKNTEHKKYFILNISSVLYFLIE
jgi:hypothetical protein